MEQVERMEHCSACSMCSNNNSIMEMKNCQQCFKPFEARADAVYCSAKCRAAANYAKNKRRDENSTLKDDKSNSKSAVKPLKIKDDGGATLKRLEDDYSALIVQHSAQIDTRKRKSETMSALKNDIIIIEEQRIPALERITKMHVVDVYNTFLNKAYEESLLSETRTSYVYLITEYEYCYGNRNVRNDTQRFIVETNAKLSAARKEVKQYKQQIEDATQALVYIAEELASTTERLRYFQQRIVIVEKASA
jgi:hypothetical protein